MKNRILATVLTLVLLLALVPLQALAVRAEASGRDIVTSENRLTGSVPSDAVSYNGHYYMLYNDSASYNAAQQKCIERGGHLATLSSAEEDSFVFNYIKGKNVSSAYFGLSDEKKEGTWEWVTGEPVNYTNWASGEPNSESSAEDYAMYYYKFSTGKWNDGRGPEVGSYYICEWDDICYTNSTGTCLADLECVDEGHYTGNMGDARVYKLDATPFSGYAPYGDNNGTKRNGNIGLNGEIFENGLEVWIARWNYTSEISWAYRTFKLDGKYAVLSGKTGLIKSYNTTNFDTTVYFYSGDTLLASYRLTPSDCEMDISVDVGGVDELKVLVKDNTAKEGGTSFALYDLLLDGETISEEITHLILADMAYENLSEKDVGKTVAEYVFESGSHGSSAPIYKDSAFSQRDAFLLVGDWTIKKVDYGNDHNKAWGYAAVVFQKGDIITIAYRGSEHGLWSIFTESADWDVDLQFALYNYLNQEQFGAALNTYNGILEEVLRESGNASNITLSGHSLGGALATYVSILTGAKAYTYDGADGHVVDLSYYVGFRLIDFHGAENMKFCNYTDIPAPKNGFSDLIQAMNTDYYYGKYYSFDKPNITLPEGYWAVPAHNIYSTTRLSSNKNTIEFTDLEDSKAPKKKWSLTFKNNSSYADPEITRLSTHICVKLGSSNSDRLVGKDSQYYVPKKLKTVKNLLFGGDGADTLVGGLGPNIFLPGALEGDTLSGGIESDLYFLDCRYGGKVYVSDHLGLDVIQLKDAGSVTSSDVTYKGKSGKWHTFSIGNTITVYIKNTSNPHLFSLITQTGKEVCKLNSQGGVVPVGGSGGGRSPKRNSSGSEYKEIAIDGDASISVYDQYGHLINSFSTATEMDAYEEYGDIFVTNDDDGKHLYAVLFAECSAVVTGTGQVNIGIVGTNDENHADKVTVAEQIDLSKGDVSLNLPCQEISQNGESIISSETLASTAVTVSCSSLHLVVGEKATLSASLLRGNNASEGTVGWQTDSSLIAKCVENEDGTCVIEGSSAGITTVYAVAEDSACYAVCTVTVTCSGDETCPGNVFADMPAKGHWAHDAIDWATVNNITAGTSATTFSPKDGCTRAQVVTFLWRAAGNPEPETTNNPFSDVKEGKYYYKAVLWAAENNITAGTSATTFSPDEICTRGQIVTFLWRFMREPEPVASDSQFTDVKAGAYYEKAVNWAAGSGVTAGTSAITFSPNDTCTRAQVVTFLYRTATLPKKSPQSDCADGHLWGDWETTVFASCTAGGKETRTCSRCGMTESRSSDSLGHDYAYMVKNAPTLMASGSLEGVCSRCGDASEIALPTLNTSDYTYSVILPASCTTTGTGRYTWKTISYGSFSFDVTLSMIAHSYDDSVTSPTCTEQGYTTHTCSVCGSNYKDGYVPALGHAYVNGTCTRCGAVDPDYEEIISGTCGDQGDNVLWELQTGSGLLTIHGSGAMKDYAFASYVPWSSYRTQIKTVVIQQGVTAIGDEAFRSCSSLSHVQFGSDVSRIGGFAFADCSSLEDIALPTGIECIDESAFNGTGYYNNPNNWYASVLYLGKWALAAETDIESAEIRQGTLGIANGAFSFCSSLTSITIPEGLKNIGKWAFSYCSSLGSITIPASVTQMGEHVFSNCTALTDIIVVTGNDAFCSVDGVLFDKSKTALIRFPAGRSCSNYVIPSSVTKIGVGAFFWCSELSGISIPSSVEIIEENAFFHCTKLTSVNIPASVVKIEERAFFFCSGLKDIWVMNPSCLIFDDRYTLGDVESTTIHGYVNSSAATYAATYGYAFSEIQ